MRIDWPDNKKFAFTIFDDTDFATIDNVGEVYRFLADLGFRTTKSVWMFDGTQPGNCPGQTCEDPAYLEWVLSLQKQGFEIGYHLATWHTSDRGRTIDALGKFGELFGSPPKVGANHSDCRENIYWGADRIGGMNRLVYNLATRFRFSHRYRGHVEGDQYFWGDICKQRITYWRNLVFADIDTLAACPIMPYHDPDRPFVNFWFASSDGSNVRLFNRCLSEENQDRLEAAGGACIMYTHFASGFHSDGELNPEFRHLIERLAKKDGWYVPVSTLLDHLRKRNGDHSITPSERSALERKWVLEKLWRGRT
jgi:hypothetical protein